MGKLHKIKRKFNKKLPLKEGHYDLGEVSFSIYKSHYGKYFNSHWWGGYRKLIDKLVREHLEGVGQAD